MTLQRKTISGWVRAGTAHTTRAGTYTITITPARGSRTYRIVATAAGHLAAGSATVILKRT